MPGQPPLELSTQAAHFNPVHSSLEVCSGFADLKLKLGSSWGGLGSRVRDSRT